MNAKGNHNPASTIIPATDKVPDPLNCLTTLTYTSKGDILTFVDGTNQETRLPDRRRRPRPRKSNRSTASKNMSGVNHGKD